MKYWVASSNRINSEITDKKLIWGIPKRNKNLHERVSLGDKILMYVRQEHEGDTILPPAISGAYEVEEKFEDSKAIFTIPSHMGEEVFPYRFRLKLISVYSPPIEFKPLIDSLDFITNKTMWSGHLRVAMREIPKSDYDKIIASGKKK